MKVFEADWICPVASPPVRRAAIAVEGGRIIHAGTAPISENAADRVRFDGCAIVPGFVNAHAHLELTLLRGFLENLPFIEWIRTLTDTKYKCLTHDELLLSARLGVVESLAAGVTAVGEVMDIGTSWDAIQEFGLQGIAYQEVFGPEESMWSEAFSILKERLDRYRPAETPTQRIGISPHAPYTVSRKLFERVREYSATGNLPLTIHIAESMDESRFVRDGQGAFADSHRQRGFAVNPLGSSPIQYLNAIGLLRPDTLLIHAIEVDDHDLDVIAAKRSPVVHCPKSNAKLGHRTARVADMLARNVILGLGTDSAASNDVVDMFEEMRTAVFQQRSRAGRIGALDAARALRMATLGGAECLGLSEHLGSLEAGKRADFVVVDLNDPAFQPVYDPIETMVYAATRHNVRATYLAGREVKVDSADLVRQVRSIAERLKAAAG